MNKLRNAFTQVLATILIAALTSSCSAEAKKARLARRAEDFFKAGDYDKAKIEYTNLLRADPKDPEPFEKIGRIWLEEGAPLRAGPFLIRARELAPARADIRAKLAEVYIAVGGLSEARKEAVEALQIEPGNETAILILADAARTPEEIAEGEQQLKGSKRTDTVNYHLAEGTLGLRKNDLAALEPALQKAIAADPKSAPAHLAMARYRLATQKKDAARVEFKLAADLAPPRNSAHLLYAEFLAQAGERDEAMAYINGILKKASDFLPAWTLLAKYTAQKNYDEAIGVLDNVFRRDAQNFDARMLESEFYISKRDSKKAVEALKQLETIYSKIPIVKYQLGRAYAMSGDNAQAAASLEQAINLAPGYGDAILLLADVNLRLGNPGPVVGAMENLLKTTPNVEQAQVLLADAYRAMGRFGDSEAILRKQIATTPQKPEPYLLLGVLLRQENKLAEARQTLEKAVELSPDKLSAVNQLVELDILAGDYPTALKRVNGQLELTPQSPGLYLVQGKIYAAQNDWERAETALLKVIELNADIPAAYELLVSVYIAANRLPQAVTQLESFLAKTPDSPGALMTLALIFNEQKDYPKARDTYEKLLAVKPDVTMAMNNLAYLYSDNLNQLDKGREWASKARNADPTNPSIADTFGWILYRQGDYKQAVTLLKESAGKLPDQAEAQYHVGMASYMMGDSKSARVALAAAVNSTQAFVGKDEAQKRLAMIDQGGLPGESTGIEQMEALLKEQPNDPMTLANLAAAYEKQGAVEKAGSTYEQAIAINPKLTEATIKLAQLYAGPLKKKDRAIELAKKARELAPANARSTAILGRLAYQVGNYNGAYSLLQESSRQLSDDVAVLKDFAWVAYSIGKVAEARRTMERIVKTNPESPEAHDARNFLSLVPEIGEGDSAALEAQAKLILEEDAVYVPALMVQSKNQVARGEKDAAVKVLSDVLARFPDFAPAQKGLAALYIEEPNNRLKAYELATSARKTLTEDPELAATLAEASFHKKENSRAVQLFQESVRKRPLGARQLYYFGMALAETKQTAQAQENLERAIAAGLGEPEVSEARKTLETFEKKPQ